MKLGFTTLSIAVLLAISLAISLHMSWVSATSTFLVYANIPGSVVAGWVGARIGTPVGVYVVCALVNWAAYVCVVQGLLLLKRKFSN
jgi:hypothetical protein